MALAVHTIQLSQLSQKIITTQGDQELVGIQDNQLADGDHIWLSVQPSDVGADGIEITLSSAPRVTWYKEVKAFGRAGNTLGWVATEDAAHGPVSMKIADVTVITNLVFTKAKAFGIHTGMYQITQGLSDHRGHKLDLNWASD